MKYLVGYERVKRDRGGGPLKQVTYLDLKGICDTAEDAEVFRQMLQDGEFEATAVVQEFKAVDVEMVEAIVDKG